MSTLGPIVGMIVLGVLVGWLLGRLCVKAVRLLLFAVVAVIALQLVGYKLGSLHWESAVDSAKAAAEATRPYAGVGWSLLTYNLPFTAGLVFGLWKSMPLGRRRK